MMMLVVVLLPFILFFRGLTVFFVQDDFWLLSISRIHTIGEFLQFFSPRADVVWYRPLSSQFFFFLGNLFFGLHPLPYHIMVLLTHLLVICVLYKLVFSFWKDKSISLLSSFLYGTHALHTISLSWLATYAFILSPLWLLLTLYFYRLKKEKLAFLSYILGLLTFEVSLIIPLLLVSYQVFFEKKIQPSKIVPYIISIFILLFTRKILFPTQVTSELYQISLSINTVSLLKFYLLRLIGIPLFIDGMSLLNKIIVSFLSFGFLAFLIFTFVRLRVILTAELKFFLSLFCIGLIPFLLFPLHVAPYYATFALLGCTPITAYISVKFFNRLHKQKRFVVSSVYVFLYIILQSTGIFWTYKTHWIYKRAELAQQLIDKHIYEAIPQSEEFFALGANAASYVYLENSK